MKKSSLLKLFHHSLIIQTIIFKKKNINIYGTIISGLIKFINSKKKNGILSIKN